MSALLTLYCFVAVTGCRYDYLQFAANPCNHTLTDHAHVSKWVALLIVGCLALWVQGNVRGRMLISLQTGQASPHVPCPT